MLTTSVTNYTHRFLTPLPGQSSIFFQLFSALAGLPPWRPGLALSNLNGTGAGSTIPTILALSPEIGQSFTRWLPGGEDLMYNTFVNAVDLLVHINRH